MYIYILIIISNYSNIYICIVLYIVIVIVFYLMESFHPIQELR